MNHPSSKMGRAGTTHHFVHNFRFYLAALAACAVYAGLWQQPIAISVIAAGDTFFICYLVQLFHFATHSSPDSTKAHARVEDDGLAIIVVLTMAAIACSLTAIFLLFRTSAVPVWAGIVAALSVPLGWMTLHAGTALHYARLYYAPEEDGGSQEGLEFPNDHEPEVWDFLYFSFVLGMTAQTSDVQITRRQIRRTVLAHSIVSFFYNAIIMALAVNAAVQFAG